MAVILAASHDTMWSCTPTSMYAPAILARMVVEQEQTVVTGRGVPSEVPGRASMTLLLTSHGTAPGAAGVHSTARGALELKAHSR